MNCVFKEQNLRHLWMAVFLFAGACRELGLVEGTPRERYERSLDRAGLNRSGLGADWVRAGRDALARPVKVALPYREAGYFAAERVAAAAFRFRVLRGQRLSVNLAQQSREPALLFADLYAAGEGAEPPQRLISIDSGETGLELEPNKDGDYVLRIQPELLRSIRYTLTIRAAPSLAFPVEGVSDEAIRSQWGAERDGGRRRHEGIDIFAPRGTPALAAVRGRIVEVGENRLGGRVVWLWDGERNQNLYYAHLDRQIAVEGSFVERGDTIGLVGNTGNARTTPTHLHFGIYRRGEGAIDPLPFVFRPPGKPPDIEVDNAVLGSWIRLGSRRTVLDGDTLEPATIMRVLSASGTRYRVELPDGNHGFLPEGSTQAASVPLRSVVLPDSLPLLDAPLPDALAIERLPAGARIGVLGRFEQFSLARTGGGRLGWLELP